MSKYLHEQNASSYSLVGHISLTSAVVLNKRSKSKYYQCLQVGIMFANSKNISIIQMVEAFTNSWSLLMSPNPYIITRITAYMKPYRCGMMSQINFLAVSTSS